MVNRRGHTKATDFKIIQKDSSVINASLVFDKEVHLEQDLNAVRNR
jgi:hypothetical protein